jgi:hypothetical protein
MSVSGFEADIFIGYGIDPRRGAEPSSPALAGGRRPAAHPGRRLQFFAQRAEHTSPLGFDPIGLISPGSVSGAGRIFPLALNFFDAFYQRVH